MGIFDKVPEHMGQSHQTKPIEAQDIGTVAIAACVILDHFVDSGQWMVGVHTGSLTLQHQEDKHRVVKVFVDYGNALARKNSLSLTPDPCVIGIELSSLDPYVRDRIRDALCRDFRWYVDPREPAGTKWWLKPNEGHYYDILFLERGACDYPINDCILDNLKSQIEVELRSQASQDS